MKLQFGVLPSKSDFMAAQSLGGLFESRAKGQMDRCKKILEAKYKVG